ncbi:hypothetical protein [Candidatus Nitrososphaera sp. FF02]
MAQAASAVRVQKTSPVFAVHLSLLGSFVSLVGYLAVVCHHVH